MRKPRGADPSRSLPHDHDREGRQPYAKEVEDYKRGVATPPEEQGGRRANSEPARERSRK